MQFFPDTSMELVFQLSQLILSLLQVRYESVYRHGKHQYTLKRLIQWLDPENHIQKYPYLRLRKLPNSLSWRYLLQPRQKLKKQQWNQFQLVTLNILKAHLLVWFHSLHELRNILWKLSNAHSLLSLKVCYSF